MKKEGRTQTKKGGVRIGTSGWMYKPWGKKFYPKDLKQQDYLSFFSNHFKTLEINTSFYHMPSWKAYEKWYNSTPRDFVFAVKVNRKITHYNRLKNVKADIIKFLKGTSMLKEKRGPLLVQLPPNFKADLVLLDQFLRMVRNEDAEVMIALEFRHKSWFEDQKKLEEVLRKHNSAMAFANSSRYPSIGERKAEEPELMTSSFIYLRLHGPKKLFASQYGQEGLKPWADKIKKWSKDGQDVYVYFNNDVHGYAIKDATSLKQFLE